MHGVVGHGHGGSTVRDVFVRNNARNILLGPCCSERMFGKCPRNKNKGHATRHGTCHRTRHATGQRKRKGHLTCPWAIHLAHRPYFMGPGPSPVPKSARATGRGHDVWPMGMTYGLRSCPMILHSINNNHYRRNSTTLNHNLDRMLTISNTIGHIQTHCMVLSQ